MSYVLRFQNIPKRAGNRSHNRETVESLFSGADVVGLAEGGHFLRDPLWVPSYPVVPYFTDLATPTFAHPDLEILGHREERAYDETDVGSWGAGPRVLAAAWPHLVKVQKEGEKPLWVGIGHHAPSVMQDVSREPAEVQDSQEERRRLWRKESRGEVQTSEGLARVVWLMDANANPNYDDFQIHKRAGFQIFQPSGESRIDLALIRGVQCVSVRGLPKRGSDHPGIEIVVE